MADDEIDEKLAALGAAVESLTALVVKHEMSIVSLRARIAELIVKNIGGDLNAQNAALMALEQQVHEIALIGIENFDPRLAAILDKRKLGNSGNPEQP